MWIVVGGVGAVVLVALVVALVVRSGSASEPTLDAQATKGQQLAKDKGCISCHTSSGNRSEGPTWKGLYGSQVTLTDGTTVTVDDAYLSKSIREPGAQVVQGYKATMPTVAMSDDDVAAIVAYIKALR